VCVFLTMFCIFDSEGAQMAARNGTVAIPD